MSQQSHLAGRTVYVVDGARSPFLKAKGVGPLSASDLAVQTGKSLINRLPIDPTVIDEVIIGSAMPGPDEANIARVIALRLGCGDQVPAFTVMRNCASGMQALDNAALQIASGRSELVLAGGTDAMSHAPILFNQSMAKWLASWMGAKTFGQKIKTIAKFRPAHLAPIIALLRGLTDPIVGLNMGQTAENLAFQFGITREEMDEFSVRSHLRLAEAFEQNRMDEVVPIYTSKGQDLLIDDGFRPDANQEKLAKLKPFFDKKYGMVTPGNSSQITDGAALLMLASEEAVKTYKLPVLGCIHDSQWAALDPAKMGLGPVYAATPLMIRNHLKANDLDLWEINEAFAAQVIACLRAWDDARFCKDAFELDKAFGAPSLDKLNVDGGAIATGHPIGASGARIVLHLLQALKRQKKKRGIAAICIGGGQGGAMLVEQMNKVKG